MLYIILMRKVQTTFLYRKISAGGCTDRQTPRDRRAASDMCTKAYIAVLLALLPFIFFFFLD